jgi:hypothetical protein
MLSIAQLPYNFLISCGAPMVNLWVPTLRYLGSMHYRRYMVAQGMQFRIPKEEVPRLHSEEDTHGHLARVLPWKGKGQCVAP